MKQQKNYDKKVKVTRILLSDYLVLKRIGQAAGVSMAEALHKLITKQEEKAPVSPAQIRMPVNMVAKPVFQVTPQLVIAVNGHKAGVFVIKPKGGVIND